MIKKKKIKKRNKMAHTTKALTGIQQRSGLAQSFIDDKPKKPFIMPKSERMADKDAGKKLFINMMGNIITIGELVSIGLFSYAAYKLLKTGWVLKTGWDYSNYYLIIFIAGVGGYILFRTAAWFQNKLADDDFDEVEDKE
jgi:hypothetical protein